MSLRSLIALTIACFLLAVPGRKAEGQPSPRQILRDAKQTALLVTNDATSKAVVLDEIANAQTEAGDREEAAKTFKLALQTASGIKDDQHFYWLLLSIAENQSKANMIKDALETANAMRNGYNKSAALNFIAVARSEAGDADGALRTALLIPDVFEDSRNKALSVIALHLSDHGDIKGALRAADAIHADFARATALPPRDKNGKALKPQEKMILSRAIDKSTALSAVAIGYAKAGQIDMAIKTAISIQFSPRDDSALSDIATVTADKGDIESARRATNTIKVVKYNDRALERICVAEAKTGAFDLSMKTLSRIKGDYYKSLALMHVATVEAQSGRRESAWKTYQRFVEIKDSDDPTRNQALKGIALGLLSAGDVSGAEEAAEKLMRRTLKADVFREISVYHAKAGRKAAAAKAFQQAVDQAGTIADNHSKSSALQEIATAQAMSGEKAGARETFQQAVKVAEKLSIGGGSDVIRLRTIATAQAKAGDRAGAKKTFQKSLKAASAYNEGSDVGKLSMDIAEAQAKVLDEGEVRAWASGFKSPIVKSYALLGVAKGMIARQEKRKE